MICSARGYLGKLKNEKLVVRKQKAMSSPTVSVQSARKCSIEVNQAIFNLRKGIKEFISANKEGVFSRSRWIECDDTGAKIYIRKGYYLVDEGDPRWCFCFANLDIPDKLQQNGIFTALLDFAIMNSPWRVIYVEIVCNNFLEDYLLKRGFQMKKGDEVLLEGTRSYYFDLANRIDFASENP